jgi:hypothetical protein
MSCIAAQLSGSRKSSGAPTVIPRVPSAPPVAKSRNRFHNSSNDQETRERRASATNKIANRSSLVMGANYRASDGPLVVLVGVVVGVRVVVVCMTASGVVTVEALVAVSAGPLPVMNSPIAVLPSDS